VGSPGGTGTLGTHQFGEPIDGVDSPVGLGHHEHADGILVRGDERSNLAPGDDVLRGAERALLP
jgi:hypothetical protein